MMQTYLNRWNAICLVTVAFFLGAFSPTALFSQQTKQNAKKAEYAALKMQPATFEHDEKWEKDGIFEGYVQQQEIIEKRSKNTKHFKNVDGTFTAQTGGNYHYKDEAGKWQGIDLTIEQGNTGFQDYFFQNVKNDVKSYFPKNAVTQGVLMKLENGSEFIWWKNPQLKITSNGSITKTYQASPVIGQASNEKLIYENIYNGISEEFVMLNGGIENNIILNSKTPEIASLSSGSTLEFSQFIPLKNGWTVFNSEGKKISSDVKTDHFSIQFGNTHSRIYFGNIVVFDNNISKEEAMLIHIPADKLTQAQKQKLEQSVYTITYQIKFVNGGIEVISALPSSWLNQSNRAFPVVIDPTVTITPSGSASNFYGPLTHWYGYQRHASLYLQSEIGIYGTITDIEYNSTTAGTAGSRPTKVLMRTTPNTTLSSGAWNSSDYITGAQLCLDENTDQGNTIGWKNLNLTAPFIYDQDNLMIMVYDAWGGGGSAKYYNQSSSVTQRQAYSRADNSDPGDDASLTIENRLHEIRITYVPLVECTGLPTSITATSSSADVCGTVQFTLSLNGIPLESGLSIQWQSSTDGGITWNNLGTPQSTFSYMVAGGQTVATDYKAIITCVPTSYEVESTVVSVGMSPAVDCVCTPPSSSCGLDDEIQNVTFEGINNNSSCTSGGYADYRSTVTPAEVLTGVSYPISVTTGDGGNESVAVWIDYNQDGIFDISEYTLVGVIAPGGTVTGNINIPGSALSGTTVMRVRSFYVASGDPSLVYEETMNSACSTISTGYGETEDYAINITIGTDCSGAPDAGTISSSITEACLNESIVLTSDASNPYVGIVYQWQASTDGGTTWNDLGAPQTSTTYTVASQTESTMYRLVATCTITSDSETSATITVTQDLPANCYCINTIPANCTDGDVITNVTIESINNNSGCGNSSTGYSDYTSTVAPAQLEAGTTVPISVTVGPSGDGWLYESVGVWIDYNQNGILDSLEGEYTNLGTGLNQALTGSIVIPSTALTGPTRMRVVLMASISMLNTYVCGPLLANNNFGEIEDYTVNILPETTVIIDSVVVATQGGVPAEISTPLGTLQLEATVYPLPVNQSVIWSIIPVSGGATISAGGLVTAQSDGTVWAKAVSVEDNTKADSILITITNQGLGITDVTLSDFTIYPNPTSDIVILKSGIEHSDLQLTVSDLTGKVIFRDNLISNELNEGYQIKLDNNSSGVYILQLTNNEINIQRQIIKK